MVDISLVWNDNLCSADWQFSGGDIAHGDDLISSILVSLFTDAEASTDYEYPVPSDRDPRGWWGNTYRPFALGSRLWQLERARNGQATLLKARDYSLAALQWLLVYGIASAVDVTASYVDSTSIALAILVTKPQSFSAAGQQYAAVWDTRANHAPNIALNVLLP